MYNDYQSNNNIHWSLSDFTPEIRLEILLTCPVWLLIEFNRVRSTSSVTTTPRLKTNKREATLDEFREALGETGKRMSHENLLNHFTVMNYLADTWLKEREISIFGKELFAVD